MRSLLKDLDYRLLLPFIARLPFPLAYRAAEWRGDWIYLLRRNSRRHAIENIREALDPISESRSREIARRHYQTLSVDEMEAFWFGRDSDFFSDYVSVEGLEDLQKAAGHPGGVLLILGHWGSSGTLFVALGKRGVSFHIVGRPLERNTDRLQPAQLRYGKKRVLDIETAVGHPFLLTGLGNFARMRELLRSGEMVMIMFDVTPNILRHVQTVQFFGRKAYFANGVAQLQRQTGARVFRGSIYRSRRHPYQRIRIWEIPVIASMSQDQLLQQLVCTLEDEIRKRPFEWTLWDSMGWFYQAPRARKGMSGDKSIGAERG
ncbi:MAG: hypothetical protein HY644_02170 [Acidobacteria bacterium]|nr:hypothetical protein [Acidobacteriota bacterium]